MSWTLVDKPKTVKATRALAQEFADMEQIRQDRVLSERRLMVYERMLKQGFFRPVTWATCRCKETDTTYRVNGMHTSTLLARQDPMPEFFVTIERYEADTLDDVARLFSTFDSRLQSRTATDINKSFAATVPELAALPTTVINLVVSAISYAADQDNYAAIPPPERAEKLLDHVPFAEWFHDLLDGGENFDATRFLQRMAVVAAMFQGFQRSRKDATAFWIAVRDQTGARPDLPDRKLAVFLMRTRVDAGGGKEGKTRTKGAPPREFLVRSLHAWNAWRKGIPTDLRYYPDAKVPVAV